MTLVNDPFPPDDFEPFPEGAPETVTIRWFRSYTTGHDDFLDHVFHATWPNGDWRELFYLPATWAAVMGSNPTAADAAIAKAGEPLSRSAA